MNLRTITASTMPQALLQVKRELGEDAVILNTRSYTRRRWMGLRREAVVEVTAGKNLPAFRPRAQATRPTPPRPAAPPAAISPKPNPGAIMQTAAAGNALVMGLSQEVGVLRDLVSDLVRETRSSRAPNVPADLLEHYTQLIKQHVAEELAAQVVRDLRAQLRPEHLQNPQFVRDRLAEQIERLLPTSGPIVRTRRTGPHVVALIGPTGVGKTTTIAKLAANLKLREGRRVGLITIDTYRIAAVDQLKKYADILGSPLRVVGSPEDLAAAVQGMADAEFVLIDTAGRSPSDALKLSELRNFITAANPDEVHLVLSSTASQECIERAVERFSQVRVDKIIFTKLDEAVHVGVVFNVIRKVNKSLSYVTTGQDVPDDIEVGHGWRLAQGLFCKIPGAQNTGKLPAPLSASRMEGP